MRVLAIGCVLAALTSGCAAPQAPRSSARDARPAPGALTATLPIAHAGIRDAREPFAAVFARELARSAGDGNVDTARWLHGAIGPSPSAAFDARFAARAPSTAVLLVPGLFGDCLGAASVPFGDGVQRSPERDRIDAYRQYADLGLNELRLATLPGRASAATNGRLLATELRALAVRPGVRHIVVVGYSKGIADALHALDELQRDGPRPLPVSALVSVAGTVMGTPLADEHRGLYDALSPHLAPLACSPEQGGTIASLTRAERGAWLAAHPLPRGLRSYSVIGHAEPGNIAWPLRWPHHELDALDARNDGQMLAGDAMLPGSALLAELRADHWNVALPIEAHAAAWGRAMAAPQKFPRAALLRALLRMAVADAPDDDFHPTRRD